MMTFQITVFIVSCIFLSAATTLPPSTKLSNSAFFVIVASLFGFTWGIVSFIIWLFGLLL